ncbi:MAG: endonuclease/exonuclease/phosphatase family protein [Planctomycetes bacterium]|nr:endonuclease/exonuclease/phosphatase family protein [Planctomycetota bacterium]
MAEPPPAAPPPTGRRWRLTNVLVLATLPAFAPALAPFVAGWHWSLDLLANFPVQAMGALALAAVLLAAARRFRVALAFGGGALLAAAAVVPDWCAGPTVTAAAPGATVRVLSLNLLRGAEANGPAAVAAVRAHDPDVLFCSELTPAWLAALAPALVDYPHRHTVADPGYYGTGLFARLPLRQAANVPLGVDWAPAVRAVVTTAAGDIGLLGVHTPRPGGAERCRNRDRALAAIAGALAGLPERRLVVGDCNATPWNHAFGAMLRAARLDAASARAFRPTWPAQLPWPLRVPIDHVLLGGGLQLVACEVGAPFGSDHLPLAATVRLTAP